MSKYMTKQRKMLLDFLSEHVDEVLSARQTAALLNSEEISVSAVYRNFAALEKDGLIKRVSKLGSREVYFQYISAPQCKECLHLSCKNCGKTYHMNGLIADRLVNSLKLSDSFIVDKSATVLYGVCAECRGV